MKRISHSVERPRFIDMQTDTILNGILALLVAERDGTSWRPTERLLAQAGLTDEHIAMLTGRDPALLDQLPTTAFGHSALGGAPARPT
jgi:hypothetical protein